MPLNSSTWSLILQPLRSPIHLTEVYLHAVNPTTRPYLIEANLTISVQLPAIVCGSLMSIAKLKNSCWDADHNLPESGIICGFDPHPFSIPFAMSAFWLGTFYGKQD